MSLNENVPSSVLKIGMRPILISKLTKQRWSIGTKLIYDKLPMNVKQSEKVSKFKNELRTWIVSSIPIEEKV